MAGEVNVAPLPDIDVHADFAAEAVDLLDPAAFNSRDQSWVGVEREMRGHLPLQAELLAISWQDQLYGRGRKADPVIEALDPVRGVDPLEGHHRHQDLCLGDAPRIARKERLHIKGPIRLHDEIDHVAGYIDARKLLRHLIDLCDDYP